MAEILTIEGNTYAPLMQAAQHLGYTKEYVLRHLTDGKFDARKINNRWYVNLASAGAYYENTKREMRERRLTQSQARKAEYEKHMKKQSHHHVALVETLAVVVIGLSLGVTGYLGTTPTTQTAALQNTDTTTLDSLALSLYALVSGTDTTSSLRGDEAIQEPSSLIVVPADSFTVEEATSLQDSFSDPVTVTEDPSNPDMGVITPVFKEGREGEEYRYLMVPVNGN